MRGDVEGGVLDGGGDAAAADGRGVRREGRQLGEREPVGVSRLAGEQEGARRGVLGQVGEEVGEVVVACGRVVAAAADEGVGQLDEGQRGGGELLGWQRAGVRLQAGEGRVLG